MELNIAPKILCISSVKFDHKKLYYKILYLNFILKKILYTYFMSVHTIEESYQLFY